MKKRQDNIYYEIPASPRIISGETALEVLGEEMRSHGATNVLLITDAVSDKSELADRLRIALTATGLRPGANYVAKRDVASYSAVYELRELYRINVCDGIIACGGEATIGTAKALRMLLSSQEADLDSIAGVDIAKKKTTIPFAAVPSGIDTSSGVTMNAYLKKENGEGREFRAVSGCSDICAVDIETGEDVNAVSTIKGAALVLSDSIEAFVSVNARKLTKCMDLFAIRAIRDSLDRALNAPSDRAAYWQLRQAGILSGLACNVAGAGLARALENALAVVCGGSREDYAGIVLPAVLAFNFDACAADYAQALYYLIGDDSYAMTASEERARKLIEVVKELFERLAKEAGLPVKLSEIVGDETKLEAVANVALGDYALMTNPAAVTAKDVADILRSIW